MLITIDMLTGSYQPIVVKNRRYWQRAGILYEAAITPLGLVEIHPVALSIKEGWEAA